jgi:di/tricarboxylate transporter
MFSRTGWFRFLLVACLVLVVVAGSAPVPAPGDAVTSAPVGGLSWYVCGAFAVGKWFFVSNPPLFAAIAIAGGLACGFGL